MEKVQIDGAHIAYDDDGFDGPAVVLIHGGTTDRRMWGRQIPVLRDRFRVISYDWLAYGDSGDVVADHARHEQLLTLLDRLGVDHAVLVGSSDGGKLSLDAALTAPERVAGLVLVGSGLSGHVWPESFRRRYRERVHERVGVERLRAYNRGTAGPVDPTDLAVYVDSVVELLLAGPARTRQDIEPDIWVHAVGMYRRAAERAWAGATRAGGPQDLEPGAAKRLAEVAAPTFVVYGAEDLPEIVAVSEQLASDIPGALSVEMPATGHVPPLERPEEFNRLLLEFLDSLDSLESLDPLDPLDANGPVDSPGRPSDVSADN
jgi:pimeloyl-ACP methyl ester carboxylesterase